MGFRANNYKAVIFLIFSFRLLSIDFDQAVLKQGINSPYDDFAPSWNYSQKTIYFSSNRSSSDKIYTFDSQVNLVKGKINSDHKNSSYITFDKNNKAIFTSYSLSEKQAIPSLFSSKFFKDSWSNGIYIDEINSQDFLSQASLSADGNHLVFVSNNGNDPKDTDIFYSHLQSNGKWSKPTNLQEINTQDQEITPLLVGSDTLLFASNGKGGKGGFDLFISTKKLGKWQRALPLTKINSEFDDSDPCILPNNEFLFVSNRVGGIGGLDIYTTNIKGEIKEVKKSDLEIDLTSFITQIRAKSKINQNIKTFIPYFLYENEETDLINKYKKYNGELFDFTVKQKTSKVNLTAWTISENESEKEQNSKSLADKRLEYLLEKLVSNGIDKNNIEINYSYYKAAEAIPDHIMVLVNGEYPASKTEEREVILEPNILGFNIDCRPVKKLEKINCLLKVNNTETDLKSTIAKVPIETSFNIEKIKNEINNSDSLVIMLEAIDINSTSTIKSYSYLISRSKEQRSEINGSLYVLAEEHLENIYFNQALRKILKDYPGNITVSEHIKEFKNINELVGSKNSIQLDQFPEKYSIKLK